MSKSQSRALLVAVSNELAEIRERLEDLADLTSGLMADCPAERHAEAMCSVQDFDLLIQRLDGLGGLAAALGAGAPMDTALHALTLPPLPLPRPTTANGARQARRRTPNDKPAATVATLRR